jgi:hypothetical protein
MRRVAFCLSLALAAFPAAAQPADELARVREEAARLRQQLDALDARIRGLEAEHGTPAPAAAPAPPSEKQAFFTLQRNWSEIRPGTPKERVDALLGKPERILRIDGDLVWYYVYPGLGRGSVFFNAEEKVSATQAPRTGWAW